MVITLDAQRIERAFAPGATLQRIVDDIRDADLDGRLVVSVSLNGRRLAADALTDALDRPVNDADQIDLESGDASSIIIDVLQELAGGFLDASTECVETADVLAGGDVNLALPRVASIVQLWQTCQQALRESSELAGRDLTSCRHDGLSVAEHLSDVSARLNDLRTALEGRDWVMLADLLRYELPPLSLKWARIAGELARCVEHDAAVAD